MMMMMDYDEVDLRWWRLKLITANNDSDDGFEISYPCWHKIFVILDSCRMTPDAINESCPALWPSHRCPSHFHGKIPRGSSGGERENDPSRTEPTAKLDDDGAPAASSCQL
jgi:hypothetical protein